ncbi:hypothetical protein CERSUDRAFT_117278 [Gelatoporia subvermispora B]|uniref:Uncharacterized protein n=1 Tax=Ceriporiopsis subvermispora (strain B) TaxID=914234 RepID=M2R6B3_CERS8|nr:hypothetical protein CERSUDRAFT_117278 [Gelatoporia subvermispora B]
MDYQCKWDKRRSCGGQDLGVPSACEPARVGIEVPAYHRRQRHEAAQQTLISITPATQRRAESKTKIRRTTVKGSRRALAPRRQRTTPRAQARHSPPA